MRALLLVTFIAATVTASAQTILFSENFESAPAFALNTADQGGATASGDNTWLINNVYAGGAGSVICFGFPLPFNVGNTPSQPGGISNANGNYMHITSVAAQNSGILSCCFLAADGLCANPASHFARMTTDVATGPADITLSFWWLCAGGTNNYGEVYYSTNSGSSWNLINTPISQYRNQSSWVQQSITLPAFSNQATLRFGFRFFNGTTTSAQDPAFALDDVVITSAVAVPPSITTSAITGTTFCQGAGLNVPYSITGTFSAGNVFTAQLSDAAGSFASPTDIGAVSSTTAGSIACTIPVAASVGSGYRIRVVSSAPAITGSDNGVNITVSAAPYAGPDGSVTLCKNSGTYNLFDYMPGASACGAWTGPNAQPFSGALNTFTDPGGVYTYNTNCPGGCPQDQATLTVALLNPANAGLDVNASLCTSGSNPPLVSYVNGGDATGIFFHNGQPTTNALLAAPGTYNLLYVVFGSAPCINDTAEFLFTVNQAPNAGSSTSVTLCQNAPATQLITLLGGTPDGGGVWTNPVGTPISGIFTPGTSQPGLYTYTVTGLPPCADAQAFVAVVVDPCAGIAESAGREPMRYLGQQGTEHLVEISETAHKGFLVHDALGSLVASVSGPFTAGVARIDMGTRSTGMYFVRLAGGQDGQVLRIMHMGR
ncbi:MAG TPA: hypothetical protein PKY96_13455 [Flavobacteriales bacterium]|nr:hypothetical protein [Flavobacteriales bacterium]